MLSGFGALSVLAFAVSPLVLASPQSRAGVDPPIVKRAKDQARRFMRDWRGEWTKGYLHVGNNPVRDAAAHCHFDGAGHNAPPNIIYSGTRKSQCPSWLPALPDSMWDERHGIDLAIRNLSARERLRGRRAALIALFDSALAASPRSTLLRGQMVRFAVDQRDSARAWTVIRGCADDPSWCALLGTYTASSFGELRRADSLAVVAERAMTREERCARIDVALLVSPSERSEWLRRPCPQRLALERAFWWLADPFWSVTGNERRAEHFVRLVMVKLRTDLESDERFDWRTRYGGDALAVMVIRYGWPTFVGWQGHRDDLGHRAWLKFHDAAVPTPSPEYMAPRIRTAPPFHAVMSSVTLTRSDWKDMSAGWDRWKRHWDREWWASEHMPLAVSAILPVPDQTVFFRRASHALMALVSREPEVDSGIARTATFVTTLAVSPSPDSITVLQPTLARERRVGFVVPLSDQAVLSVEMLPDSGRLPAGRSRFSVIPPTPLRELPRGEIALSDIALYDARGDAPATIADALPLMFPSGIVPENVKLGLFWEVYGLREGEPVDVEFRVETEAEGFLRRLGGLTGLMASDAAVNIRWRLPGPGGQGVPFVEDGVRVQSHVLAIDSRSLKRGRYMMTLRFTRPGAPSAASIREFEVR